MFLNQLWIFFISILLLVDQVKGHATQPSRLTKVESIKNPTITFVSTPFTKRSARDLTHLDHILLEFRAFEKSITLSLQPNIELFHPDAQLLIFNHNGSTNSSEPLLPQDHFIFKGHVGSNQDQWARIIFRNDLIEHATTTTINTYPQEEKEEAPIIFEGTFTYNSDLYHIKTTPNYNLSKRTDDPFSVSDSHMVIYRDSDQLYDSQQILDKRGTKKRSPNDIMCAMEEMAYNRKMTGSHAAPISDNTSSTSSFSSLWEKRNSLLDVTYSPMTNSLQGCPTARKIAYMGAAADCSYVLSYGSIRYAKLQMINDWNVASAVYERTFNVSLGLIYLQISVPECPTKTKSSIAWNQACSNYYTINDRLSDFSLWRGKKGDDGAALWHLMTKCSTGVKVGIAWLSQLCETQVSQQIEDNGSYEWVSGTGVSSITRDEWKVVAHEIGHGFGSIHDCTDYMCPCQGECGCCPLTDTVCSAGDTYLMNPTSNVTTNDFSPCSISDICSTFPNIGYCLKTPDLRMGGSFSLCGNGILEPGEECDPGLTDSPCCFSKTCKLKPNAVCDDYSNQCCLNCAIAPANTVCRPAVSECDMTEYCTGHNSSCPPDLYDQDGSSCANGTMKCASGVCTSRDQQCMARGLRQNISQQCSFQQDSCLISCTDPKDSRNCLMLSGMFLDGTECGLAGFCEKGTCVGTGAWNTLKAWVSQNKSIAIPVFLFGSIGILLIIGWIIWFVRRRYRKRKILLSEKDKDSRPNSIINNYNPNKKIIDEQQQHLDDAIVLGNAPNNNRKNDSNNTINILSKTTTSTTTTTATSNTLTNSLQQQDGGERGGERGENIELDNLSTGDHSSDSRSRRNNSINPFSNEAAIVVVNGSSTTNSSTSAAGTHRRGRSFGFTA